MANAKTPGSNTALPDWWQREKQQRQLRILIGLLFVLALIGYYYWESGRPKAFVTLRGDIPDSTNYIAFVRQDKDGNTDVYAIRADGGSPRRLTDPDDKSGKETPIWAPDGNSLYYVTNRKDNRTWQVYTLGSGEFAQFTYGTGNKSAPVMSPDGKSMAFIAQGAIKTVALKGSDPPYQLMPPPDNGAGAGGDENSGARPVQDSSSNIPGPFRSVALSSDGRGVAGVKDIGGGDESQEAPEDVELGNQVAFAIPPGSDKSVMLSTGREVSAAWDPKGLRVACSFTEYPAKRPDGKTELNSGIMVWGLDDLSHPTEKPLLLTRGFSDEPRNIAWSPDGTRMAFEVWQAKSEEDRELKGIAVMDVNMSTMRPVMRYMIQATSDGKQQHPVWSPDGSRLLYEVVRKDGKRDLWVINGSDGTDPVNLTNGAKDGSDNYEGSWAPKH